MSIPFSASRNQCKTKIQWQKGVKIGCECWRKENGEKWKNGMSIPFWCVKSLCYSLVFIDKIWGDI
jgi:hypothetical protein